MQQQRVEYLISPKIWEADYKGKLGKGFMH